MFIDFAWLCYNFFFISIPKHSRENHEMSVKHLVWNIIGSLILKTRIGTFRIKTVLEDFSSVIPSYLPFLFFLFCFINGTLGITIGLQQLAVLFRV